MADDAGLALRLCGGGGEAMTATSGRRANSAQTRKLGEDLRQLFTTSEGFWNLGLRKRKKRRTSEPYLQLNFHTRKCSANAKGSIWLTLDCDANASTGRVLAAATKAVEKWRTSKKETDAPMATGDLARNLRKAKARLEEKGITHKQLGLNRRWLEKAAIYLEERGQSVEREPLLAFIRSIDAASRNRRNATTAAFGLYAAAHNGERLHIPAKDRYVEIQKPADPGIDKKLAFNTVLKLWEIAPASVAWVTSVCALTGIRGAMAMSLEQLHTEEALDWSVPSRLNCFDNKARRRRAHPAVVSWPELLDAIGTVRMNTPPDVLRECASPWDRPSTSEEQLKTERCLQRVANWLATHTGEGKKLTEEERDAVRFVPLRHLAAFRLLDLPGLRESDVSELLSTSTQMLQRIYSRSQRYKAHDRLGAALRQK